MNVLSTIKIIKSFVFFIDVQVLPSQILQKVPSCQDVYRPVGTKYPKRNLFLPQNHCQNESPSFPQFPIKHMYQSSIQ